MCGWARPTSDARTRDYGKNWTYIYNSWSYLLNTKSIQQGLRDSVTLLADTRGLPDCCANQSRGVSLTSWSPLLDCKLWEGKFPCLSYLFLYLQNLMHRSEEKVWIQDNIGPLRSASLLLLFYNSHKNPPNHFLLLKNVDIKRITEHPWGHSWSFRPGVCFQYNIDLRFFKKIFVLIAYWNDILSISVKQNTI